MQMKVARRPDPLPVWRLPTRTPGAAGIFTGAGPEMPTSPKHHGLELVEGDVVAVLGRYDASSLVRRHGDSGISTRRQQATSRSSSEYTRN